jgi:hypothetical protein
MYYNIFLQSEEPKVQVDFNPPYWLSGSGLVSWALKKTLPKEFLEELKKHKLTPIKIFGCYFCLVILSHYTDVPAHPEPYKEIILSTICCKKFCFYAVPWALYLDSEFHVKLGKEYYSLPKQLDKSFSISFSNNLFYGAGKEFVVKGVKPNLSVRVLTWPLSFVLSKIVCLATRIMPVVGILQSHKTVKAKIPLTPRSLRTTPAFGTIIELRNENDKEKLCVLWTQTWETLVGSVQEPKPFV